MGAASTYATNSQVFLISTIQLKTISKITSWAIIKPWKNDDTQTLANYVSSMKIGKTMACSNINMILAIHMDSNKYYVV